MNHTQYCQLVLDTAREFISECTPDMATRPSTALTEKLDGIVDTNWTDQDAFDSLRFSNYPSAEAFNTGGYRPLSMTDPFPIKAFALPAFSADVKADLDGEGFDFNQVEQDWEAANEPANEPEGYPDAQ